MHPKSIASPSAGQPVTDLVLEPLPSGELAWLRPETEHQIDDSARYVLTDAGRAALEEDARARELEALFGPWPTVAEAGAA